MKFSRFLLSIIILMNVMFTAIAQNNKEFVFDSSNCFDSLMDNEIKQDLSCFVQNAPSQTQTLKKIPLNRYYSDLEKGGSSVFFDERSVLSNWGISISLQASKNGVFIEEIRGFVHGKVDFYLPKETIEDIPNPYFSIVNAPHWLTGRSRLRKPIVDNWKVFKSKRNDYLYIYFKNERDGYEVTWVIKNYREYVTRVIDKLD